MKKSIEDFLIERSWKYDEDEQRYLLTKTSQVQEMIINGARVQMPGESVNYYIKYFGEGSLSDQVIYGIEFGLVEGNYSVEYFNDFEEFIVFYNTLNI